MLIRFADINCATCTVTVDLEQVRAVSMLIDNTTNTYFVRLSFTDSGTVVVKQGLTLAEATALRNRVEFMWNGISNFGTDSEVKVEEF